MDKDVIHTYNGLLLSHKRVKYKKKSETMLFAATWMQPQIIVLSEVRKINI